MSDYGIKREWNKIKDYNIFPSYEDFKVLFDSKPNGKCLRKYPTYEWCKENFFFGTANELLEFYKSTTNMEVPFYLNKRVGEKFGRLTIKEFFRKNGVVYSKCVCDCGKECFVKWKSLYDGDKKTCGCRMHETKAKKNINELYPEMIRDFWDFDKNKISPTNVYIDDDREFWWKGYNFSYKMPIKALTNRTMGGTSFPEQIILYFFKKYFPKIKNRYKLDFEGSKYEVDIYIPEIKLAIEYDGVYFHKEKLDYEQQKNLALSKNKIYFIRLREKGLLSTGIKNGLEIFQLDKENARDFLIKSINQVSKKIKQKYKIEIDEMTFLLYETLYKQVFKEQKNSFVKDNIMSTWISKWWADDNGFDPYSVSENSTKCYSFLCNQQYVMRINLAKFKEIVLSTDALYPMNKDTLLNKNYCEFGLTGYCHCNYGSNDKQRDVCPYFIYSLKDKEFALRDNEKIVLVMIGRDYNEFTYLSERLKNNREFILEAVKRNPHILIHVSDIIKDDDEIIYTAILKWAKIRHPNLDTNAMQYASERLKDNDEFFEKIINISKSSFEFFSERIRDDYNKCVIAIKASRCNYKYVSERLKSNLNILKHAIKGGLYMYDIIQDGPDFNNMSKKQKEKLIEFFKENYSSKDMDYLYKIIAKK